MPPAFREQRREVLHATIDAIGFATLVTSAREGLQISHLPMLLVPEEGACGTLYGHVARGNAHGRMAGEPSTAIFLGPHAYVSASVYPGKHVHGREVPTWNYVAVHALGTLTTFDEPSALRTHLAALTQRHERARPQPWHLGDAPADYVEKMIGAIVGLRLPIERLDGKRKLSQNRAAADRAAVLAALETEDAGARAVGAQMREVS